MSYRCSLPSPLQKRSKDYKGLHWCQNPAEDLFGLSASLLASLCSDSSLRSCYFGPEEIFKEYGFMWGTKPKKVLCWAYLIFVTFFTPTHFKAWKFYTQKCINSRQKWPRDKTEKITTAEQNYILCIKLHAVCKITHSVTLHIILQILHTLC